jgi:hypothetical protein
MMGLIDRSVGPMVRVEFEAEGRGFAELDSTKFIDVARLAKPYTQAQLATEIARLLPITGLKIKLATS